MKKAFIICLLAAAVSMAQRQRVVVLPSIADPETKFSARELDVLTEKLRGYASDILPLDDFALLKQDYVKEKLGDEALFEACKEGTCVGDLIAMVQANFGARCDVFSVKGKLWLKFELYGTLRDEDDARTISTFSESVKDLESMMTVIEKKVPDAFRKILLPKPSPAAPPPAKPAAPAASETKSNAEAYFKRGVEYFDKTDYDRAISEFTEAIRLNPNYAEAYSKRGMAHGNKGDYDIAISDFNEAIRLNPKDVNAYYNRGLTYGIKGNNDEAIADYKSALLIDPNHSGAKEALESITAPPPAVVAGAKNEPYEPSAAIAVEEEGNSEGVKRRIFSWGIRGGFNFSHFYATYDNGYVNTNGTYKSTPGFQLGLVFDWALTDWFHIQPGAMWVMKGTKDNSDIITSHNLEFPLLLSLKFSALRINAGPYFGGGDDFDFGLSAGFGFDIGWFYIGVFYDYGLIGSYNSSYSDKNNNINSRLTAYNRTLGLNMGVNL